MALRRTHSPPMRSFARCARLARSHQVYAFQVTVPGPGTTAYPIQVPADDLAPRAREALWRALERVLAGIPSEDLTIQVDVAMEAVHEVYLRRRVPMELPIQEAFHWTQAQMADSVAWLA